MHCALSQVLWVTLILADIFLKNIVFKTVGAEEIKHEYVNSSGIQTVL